MVLLTFFSRKKDDYNQGHAGRIHVSGYTFKMYLSLGVIRVEPLSRIPSEGLGAQIRKELLPRRQCKFHSQVDGGWVVWGRGCSS